MRKDFMLEEMMAHVPILAHGRVERVLIVGAAGPGLALEVRRHGGVRDVVQAGADDTTYLRTTPQRFDLVLAPGLASENALRDARGTLRAGGLVITTLGAPFVQPRRFFANMKNLAAVFAEARTYLVPVPGTFGGPVALGWGSNVVSPHGATREILAARLAAARIETHYYTPDMHRASFALPRFVQALVDAAVHPREEAGMEALGRALSSGDSSGARHAW
jgi:spermidine synthase